MGTGEVKTAADAVPEFRGGLKGLDYSVVQQCIHCGMCLPVCPTYTDTQKEKSGPRGRIALMRAIADGELAVTRAFGEEMYFCLGCLACETACPADVDYARLIAAARAETEAAGVMDAGRPGRRLLRRMTLGCLFRHPWLLRAAGRMLRWYQISGFEALVRRSGVLRLAPRHWREMEALTPRVSRRFSDALIDRVEQPRDERPKYRVGLLSGCVQDLVFPDVNRDTADALLANGCAVVTPRRQPCCGALHAHNGLVEHAKEQARRLIDAFDIDSLDAIVSNAAGCGAHLKHYGRLLQDDAEYATKAETWSAKLKDISEWLVEIGIRRPKGSGRRFAATCQDACHLCHGQGITDQPREVLRAVPGLELRELPESTHCCGSAGVYNLTHPEMAGKLLRRKVTRLLETGATVVAGGNPGCNIQIAAGLAASSSGREETAGMAGGGMRVRHPVSLLAEAYRREGRVNRD